MKRLDFLRKTFNVLPDKEYENRLKEAGVIAEDTPLGQMKGRHALFFHNPQEDSVIYPEATFNKIIEADPTKNQMYVQWLMNMLTHRLDLLVENRIIVEVKSLENLAPVHYAQLLTYLKLSELELGLLINFNTKLLKDGIHRIVN